MAGKLSGQKNMAGKNGQTNLVGNVGQKHRPKKGQKQNCALRAPSGPPWAPLGFESVLETIAGCHWCGRDASEIYNDVAWLVKMMYFF